MLDPFALALRAMLSAPGSEAAIYQPETGSPFPIRVMVLSADADSSFGAGSVRQRARTANFAVEDVPAPAAGDLLILGGELVDDAVTGGEIYRFFGEFGLDAEGVTWTVTIADEA